MAERVTARTVTRDVDSGTARLTRVRTSPDGWSLSVNGNSQSYVDLVDPLNLRYTHLSAPFQVMDSVLPRSPVHTLHVGGATMSIPRALSHSRPRSSALVVEFDAALADMVLEHAPLRPEHGIQVLKEPGEHAVANMQSSRFDLAFSDAFVGDTPPPSLETKEHLAEVRRVVKDDGFTMIHLHIGGSRDLDDMMEVGRRVEESGFTVVLSVPKKDSGSVLVIGGPPEMSPDDLRGRIRSRRRMLDLDS